MEKIFFRLVLGAVLVFSWAGVASAQQVDQMVFQELVGAANTLIEAGTPEKAIPFLEEIVNRSGTSEDRDTAKSVQQVRLQLGQIYGQIYQFDKAKKYIQDYLSSDLGSERASALRVLCQVFLIDEDWAALKKAGQTLQNEPDKSREDREFAEFCLVQAFYNEGDYAAALELLPGVLDRVEAPDMLASFRLIEASCLFETGQAEALLSSLPDRLEGAARYDLGMNTLLIRLGDEMFGKGSFRDALSVYRQVVPRQDLLAWQENRKAGIQEVLGKLEERRIKAEIESDARNRIEEKMKELQEESESFPEIPAYDLHLEYRMGQIYANQKRLWEAAALYDRVSLNYPEEELGQAALYEKIVLFIELGLGDKAVALGTAYLETQHKGIYPRLVASTLMRYFFTQKNTDGVLDVFGYSSRWAGAASAEEKEPEAVVRYMACFAWLERADFPAAARAFDEVIEFAPASRAAIDSQYWRAMCSLMLQDYQDALQRFGSFRKNYPEASFAPEALFREGVSCVGLEDYPAAKAKFDEFIETNPDSELMPEALAMRGDLLGADGKLDDALADYQRAMDLSAKVYAALPDGSPERTQAVVPATYALTQAANTLEMDARAYAADGEYDLSEQRYGKIVDEVENYEKLFGDDADWAQSVFLKGQAQLALGKTDEAVNAYLDTVIKYGADPLQQGVGSILFDLGAVIQTELDATERDAALVRIREAAAEGGSKPLQLRLSVLLAKIDGSQSGMGRRLLAAEDDLNEIPPSALDLMCTAALEQEDFSRSEEFFNWFTLYFSDSPYINSAYHLRAEELFRNAQYEEAAAVAADVLSLFGTTPEVGWAQLLKGRAEMELKKYAQAAETFNAVFNVPQWRGPISAEAMFRMADAWFAQGGEEGFRKAHAFYERTYLLYKFYDDGRWAADAYLKDAQCLSELVKLGREPDYKVRNIYRAMLLNEYVRDLPQADRAKEALGPEETADLLAGGTNRLEAASTEMNKQ
jgi:tetratricopeptide (TPR) repeat protein